MLQLMPRHTLYNTLLDGTRNPQDVLSSFRHGFSLSWRERGELLLLRFSGCGEEASSEDAAAAMPSMAEPSFIWEKKFGCVRNVAGRDAPDSTFHRHALRNNTGVRLHTELSTRPPLVKPKQAVRDYGLSQPAIVEMVKGKEHLRLSPRSETCIHHGKGQLVQNVHGSPCSPEQSPQ